MNVLLSLSLWFAMMMSSCRGGGDEVTTSDYYYDDGVTGTPEYDYTATFDYYYVTGLYPDNQAAGIGRSNPLLLLGLAVYHMWS